jgi:hypothetical protein
MSYDHALRREQTRELLAGLAPGGSPERPIVVTSSAVIEPRAIALPCPQCNGEHRVLEHTRPRRGNRRVDVQCRHCSSQRTLWFRLVDLEAN